MTLCIRIFAILLFLAVSWTYQQSVDAESNPTTAKPLGHGNGEKKNWGPDLLSRYDDNLKNRRIRKGSVRFQTSDGLMELTDDSQGRLIGAGKGAINYATSLYHIQFHTPPARDTQISVIYEYEDEPILIPAENPVTLAPNRRAISPQLQGVFPIHMPSYNGLEQVILLSSKWVIVVNYNLQEVCNEIQKFAIKDTSLITDDFGNDFLAGQALFGTNSYWKAKSMVERSVERFGVQARLIADGYNPTTQTFALDQTSYYKISSQTDPNYSKPQPPTQMTRFVVSRGGQIKAGFDIDYAHYSYLEMPSPLVNGNTYTITLGDGKSATFLYDEMATVSRAIKVNQVGYLNDVSKKYAYIGGYLWELGPMKHSDLFQDSELPNFSVVDVHTGQIAFSGSITLPPENRNPKFKLYGRTDTSNPYMYGEDVYVLDLSGLNKPGTYFITVPGVGRSWPFTVGPSIYGEAFYTAMRGLYTQRCGIALDRFAPGGWYRGKCHPDAHGHPSPTCRSQYVSIGPGMDRPIANPPGHSYESFDVNAATSDCSQEPIYAPVYGWHDAADWDKQDLHYTNVLALLTLFEIFPKKFTDGQLNLPHLPEIGIGGSGDGIPDILNEAIFGMLVWKNSLSKEGGASGSWETHAHPLMDSPEYKYNFGERARWPSLLYAAAAAQLARLLHPFNAEQSEEWAASAITAYEYGVNPANDLNVRLKDQKDRVTPNGEIIIHAIENRGAGLPYTCIWNEKEQYNWPYLVSAQIQMYLLTGDTKYLVGDVHAGKDLNELLLYVLRPLSFTNYFSFLYYGIFHPNIERSGRIPITVLKAWRDHYIETANTLVKYTKQDAYRRAMSPENENTWWGLGSMTNYSRLILLAHSLKDHRLDPEAREAAVFNADYQMGANPQGMSMTTGIGYVYPIHLQHTISEADSITDPFPGLSIYGANADWERLAPLWLGTLKDGNVVRFLTPGHYEGGAFRNPPRLRQYATHPWLIVSQNEFTIHETMASNTFVMGYLMNDGWMPSKDLTERLPLDDPYLFGFWYLP